MRPIRCYTQEDPIGLAGGLNLYGFADGDPVNFSDPFGLCWKDKEGKEDPNCRRLVEMLRRAAATVDAQGGRNYFEEAAAAYERTNRRVEYVEKTDRDLNQRGINTDARTDNDSFGRTLDAVVKIRYNARAGDLLAVAAHEAVVHFDERQLYLGDLDPNTRTIDEGIWDQLPGRLKPFAPYWRYRTTH